MQPGPVPPVRERWRHPRSWCRRRTAAIRPQLDVSNRVDHCAARAAVDRVVILDPGLIEPYLIQLDTPKTTLGPRHLKNPLNGEGDRDRGVVVHSVEPFFLDP